MNRNLATEGSEHAQKSNHASLTYKFNNPKKLHAGASALNMTRMFDWLLEIILL